jgi:hypothetical protein
MTPGVVRVRHAYIHLFAARQSGGGGERQMSYMPPLPTGFLGKIGIEETWYLVNKNIFFILKKSVYSKNGPGNAHPALYSTAL